MPINLAFSTELHWSTGSDTLLRSTGKHAHKLDRDEPISMFIWLEAAVGEIAIFVPESLCTAAWCK